MINEYWGIKSNPRLRYRTLTSTVALAVGLSALSNTARAAEETDKKGDETFMMEEVIVTATRRSQSVQDVPYNISAISGDTIEKANVIDTAELLRAATGISIIIRGLSVDSAALGDYAVAGNAPVSAYINETPMFANLMLKDLERVEVLRGPQGTLYGSGSLGGTVRFITKQPQLGEWSGKVAASLSHSRRSASVGYTTDGVINVPLGEKAAVRVVGSLLDYPGVTDYRNVYVLDENGIPVAPDGLLSDTAVYERKKDVDTYDAWFGRASLLVEASDNLSLSATYLRQSSEAGGRRGTTPGTDGWGVPYEEGELGSIQLEPGESDVEMGALEATLDLGFATLTSSTSYYDHHGGSTSENTGFYAQVGWLAWYYNYPRPMASAVRTYGDKSLVQEVRLVSQSEGPLNYVVGVYYQDQDLYTTQDSYLRGANAYVDALNGFDVPWVSSDRDYRYRLAQTVKQYAVFGELTYSITDQLDVTAGIRAFKNKHAATVHQEIPFWVDLFPVLDEDFEDNESKALFKGNITYRMDDDRLLYANFSQGFRRGGLNGVPSTGRFAEDPDWNKYIADFVDNYEIGFKGSLQNHRYTISAFYVNWRDPQINFSTPNWGFFAVTNGEKATTKGVEIELDGYLSEGLHYTIGYALADSKLGADMATPTGFVIAEDGARLPGSAKHSLNLGLDYTTPLTDKTDLTLRGSAYIQSNVLNTFDSSSLSLSRRMPDYGLFNASATFAMPDMSITLWAKNLFDARAVSAVFTQTGSGTAPDQGYYGNGAKEQLAQPRTIGVSVTYNF